MIKRLNNKKLGILFGIAVLGLLWNCKSTDVTKGESYLSEIHSLEQLMQNDTYYIEVDVAYPFVTAATQQVANAILMPGTGNSASRIDVAGDGHFIEIQADTVKGDLSFFGERRLNGGSYGRANGGIVFEGIPKAYEKTINKENRTLNIEFNISGEGTENYDINLKIYPNHKAVVDVRSNFRTVMRYDGRLKPKDNSQ
ncbi:DUF4251 domain-containing protein [Winogradskyella sp. F6397]|uniref:DUF4251 domain-containing protein n=1 Tax=Winogradskyella marina TaxID=2785530 RepID=A0ABS0EGD0_9FLAO|nr:DUF4251 domain-containing protein [Winogradskyella marina]MBF8149503.1 DUF4251 domain-containing protein [Winogradskyella marina]